MSHRADVVQIDSFNMKEEMNDGRFTADGCALCFEEHEPHLPARCVDAG